MPIGMDTYHGMTAFVSSQWVHRIVGQTIKRIKESLLCRHMSAMALFITSSYSTLPNLWKKSIAYSKTGAKIKSGVLKVVWEPLAFRNALLAVRFLLSERSRVGRR